MAARKKGKASKPQASSSRPVEAQASPAEPALVVEPEVADEEVVPLQQETTADIDPSLLSFDVSTWTAAPKDMDLSSMAMFPDSLPTSELLDEQSYDSATSFLAGYTTPSNTTGLSPPSLLNSHQGSSPSASGQTPSSTSPSAAEDSEFPDSFLLPVHELTVLRGLMRIAKRIGVDTNAMWSLDSASPFTLGGGTPASELPRNWRPTMSQLTIAHHPIMDFLPWPGARDRLISMMSLPEPARPAHAAGPLALVNFAYDLEDGSEGVRIYGGDPCDPDSWEVGQVFFERWWFIFDRAIIDNSNKWRRLRGAPPLYLKG